MIGAFRVNFSAVNRNEVPSAVCRLLVRCSKQCVHKSDCSLLIVMMYVHVRKPPCELNSFMFNNSRIWAKDLASVIYLSLLDNCPNYLVQEYILHLVDDTHESNISIKPAKTIVAKTMHR